MVKSKFKFLGVQTLFTTTFFFLVVTILFLDTIGTNFFGFEIIHKIEPGKHQGVLSAMTIVAFILITFFFFSTMRFINIISIDAARKTISFTNILSRKTTTYLITDFDGYYDTIRSGSSGYRFKEIYLMKNNKAIRKISQYYYSNFDTLIEGIEGLNHIGTFEYSFEDSIRMFFNSDF